MIDNKKIAALLAVFAMAGTRGLAQQNDTVVADSVTVSPSVVKLPAKIELAFGDSLAHGMLVSQSLSGDTKPGRMPHQILAAMQAYDPTKIAGKNVVLSSGAANNYFGVEKYLPLQIRLLKAAGARSIVVIGVSVDQKSLDPKKVNAQISGICKREGAIYAGEITNTYDGIHPRSYNALFAQATRMLRVLDVVKTLPTFTF